MRKILITFVLFFGLFNAFGQTLAYDDYSKLTSYLKVEDWQTAFQESSKMLNSAGNDSSDYHAMLIYINIYAAVGMVIENQMTYEELENNIVLYQGQKIIVLPRPVTSMKDTPNKVRFDVVESSTIAYSLASNLKGDNIFCSERYVFNEIINTNDFPEGSFVRFGGTLEEIEINSDKSINWVLRFKVINATLTAMN